MKYLSALSVFALIAYFSFSGKAKSTDDENLYMLMEGPGPAECGSYNYNGLPVKAKSFIGRFFKNLKIMNIEKDFDSDKYDVTFGNGLEIEFNENGDVNEIESVGESLPEAVVKELLPKQAVKTLSTESLHRNVEKIEIRRGTYSVEFFRNEGLDKKQMKFNIEGEEVW